VTFWDSRFLTPRVAAGGKAFADFMLAPETQAVVKTFGVEKVWSSGRTTRTSRAAMWDGTVPIDTTARMEATLVLGSCRADADHLQMPELDSRPVRRP